MPVTACSMDFAELGGHGGSHAPYYSVFCSQYYDLYIPDEGVRLSVI